MTLKILTVVICMTICASCASHHSNSSTFSESQKFSTDTNAQIRKIQDDYGVKISIFGHRIVIVTEGLIPTERMESIERALHEIIGNDFTNYTIALDIN